MARGAGPDREELGEVLRLVSAEAERYLAELDTARVRMPEADESAESVGGALPEAGDGAAAALTELLGHSAGLIASSGPRYFHFVTGGVTPAALGADWLATAVDQNNGDWGGAPLAAQLEAVAIRWLLELFGLPAGWSGVLTTGATMANFVGLAAARRWWGLRQGVDVDEQGFAGLPRARVFASGYVHPSDTKALAMLGLGRDGVERLSADPAGRLDLAALETELRGLGGEPSIVIASAGEVNAGDFDPVDAMADLAHEHGAWLHVDGAFGLFAAVSPRTAHLVAGIEKADSVIADGHKWLNVPYDCGFAFVRDPALSGPTFALNAAYLPSADDPHPGFFSRGPESSRRARSLAVWATLRAYGRAGYREIVERHLDLAQRLAARVDAAPDLERLGDVPLNIVCFRYRPPDVPEERLDELNRQVAAVVVEVGRVIFGSTVYEGRAAFRPAIVNWRTRERDVDLIVDVTREVGARVGATLLSAER
ncbi:MAG TPA: aminotransferase class V-fold PLP-dependent enzyme [Solirubrobacterales bacterium]|nr:aminotransferase class V-fold PLP-dependent enzyme [Solirubrobacterales bacterium]